VKEEPEACLTCGAPAEPGQEYCLHCGERIVPPRPSSAVGRAWERRFGRYPGDWVWASLLLLLVAAGSATAGIVTARDTGTSGGSETIVATSRVVPAPPVTTALTPPTSTGTAPVPTPPAPKSKPTPKPRDTLTEWPARDGYTVILTSVPARGTGLEDANATAKAALAAGVRDVGVLVSGRFASLHPGYYVVFAGVYGSLQEAQTATGRISSKFPNAYARQITR
jgi:hypothetical protein